MLNNFMFEVTRSLTIEYAHRLLDYKDPLTGKTGPCANIHGHSGLVKCTISGNLLEPTCMLLDFKIVDALLKDAVGMFDHALILQNQDPLVEVLKDQGLRIIVVDNAPTAEYLSVLALVTINSLIIQTHAKNGLNLNEDDDTIIEKICSEKVCTKLIWYETRKSKAQVNLTKDLLLSSITSVRTHQATEQKMN